MHRQSKKVPVSHCQGASQNKTQKRNQLMINDLILQSYDGNSLNPLIPTAHNPVASKCLLLFKK